ncbi:hypothetical protein B0O99DRAFT_504411 [Bisporella sp. PMI_857]|nr:hypothetical protein B0O99DRAFT_504411 [Bisporella sp. PMI_857]
MLSYINKARGLKGNIKGAGVRGNVDSNDDSSSGSSQSGLQNARDGQILFTPAVPASKKKKQSPQDSINEFWSKFDSKTPGRASTILPKNNYAKRVGASKKLVIPGENAVASYEEAAKTCKDKVARIVKECRRVNQKYRDPHFDIEFDLKWGINNTLTSLKDTSDYEPKFSPGSVKRVGDIFEQPEFYKGGAAAEDIRQGADGDCWFLAALSTLANKQGLIEKVCVARDENVGVYGFVIYRDGEWVSEIIDDKLFLIKPDYDESWVERNLIDDHQRINSEEDYQKIYQSGSSALYFAQCEDPNETWLPLLEKAFAKAHGDYEAIEGGFTGEAIEDLTGGVTTEIFSSDILDKEYFWKEELLKVNKDFLFGCAAGIFWGPWGERKGIIEGHAYSIMRAVEIDGKRLVLLRNPWGTYEWKGAWSDGSKEWTPEWMQKLDHRFGDDGAFWMSYEDLLKKYQTFDRTRLFDDEWKVTQQWTQLEVSWSTDYHSTKFAFTVEKKAPIVLVLSQLDGRYFCGLGGQYQFKLSFRVHKSGEEEYIVRSHGNYWMSRSVTAELELDPGEYHVLVKVEAEKRSGVLPVEDVVRNNAKDRRDKLIRIGLSYDLAHAKGQIRETHEEKKLRKRLEEKQEAKEKKEFKEKLMKEKKKRKHMENRELRKQRAAAEKRKAKAKAKAAKRAEKEKELAGKKELAEKKTEQAGSQTTSQEHIDVEIKSTAAPTLEKSDPAGSLDVTAATEEGKATNASITPGSGESMAAALPVFDPKKDETAPATSESTSKDEDKEEPQSIPTPPVNLFGFDNDDDDDDDDLSDLESVVSDISSAVIEDAIAEAKEAAKNAPPPSNNDDEDDEFQRDPWNAVAVVGLRIYSKGSAVSVKVVRRRMSEDLKDEEKEDEKAESRLDVDDSAVDATKGIDLSVPESKGESKEGSTKADVESEGSIVVV